MLEVAIHELGFLPQPARANAEQETATAEPIEAGDLLGQEEGVALGKRRGPQVATLRILADAELRCDGMT